MVNDGTGTRMLIAWRFAMRPAKGLSPAVMPPKKQGPPAEKIVAMREPPTLHIIAWARKY
jgi:hypothetical protein